MVLMLGVMYVLMIRPQRQRQAQQQTMIGDAGVGDDVLTTGGIYGTITHAEGDDIVVEIASGVTVHMTRRGIAAVLAARGGGRRGRRGRARAATTTPTRAMKRPLRTAKKPLGAPSARPRREMTAANLGRRP